MNETKPTKSYNNKVKKKKVIDTIDKFIFFIVSLFIVDMNFVLYLSFAFVDMAAEMPNATLNAKTKSISHKLQ